MMVFLLEISAYTRPRPSPSPRSGWSAAGSSPASSSSSLSLASSSPQSWQQSVRFHFLCYTALVPAVGERDWPPGWSGRVHCWPRSWPWGYWSRLVLRLVLLGRCDVQLFQTRTLTELFLVIDHLTHTGSGTYTVRSLFLVLISVQKIFKYLSGNTNRNCRLCFL